MRLVVFVLVAALALPGRAAAWGFDAHHLIMERAIALLPPELRPLFEKHRAKVVERVIDPDTWRAAGFSEEEPNHFLDLDWEGYGKDPFRELPRDYTAAIAKFGRARILQNGTVPWRTEEMFGNLERAFRDYERRGAFGQIDIIHFSAWLGHYVSDAIQPFHGVINFDGQLTQQNGVHARFESTLVERYKSQLVLAPKPLPPVRAPRDFIFERLIEDTRLAPVILKADLDAIGSRDMYDDAYYDAFFRATRPVLEQRLNDSIAAVAAVITGAWEAAGRPPVPVSPAPPPPPPRRRARP
ncbi:MAG TPA: hypothetical protein VGQ37_00445 [Vicinamibacterales bacterium]|nr:hypothetical protein [Vicinamibacterales bacterium]